MLALLAPFAVAGSAEAVDSPPCPDNCSRAHANGQNSTRKLKKLVRKVTAFYHSGRPGLGSEPTANETWQNKLDLYVPLPALRPGGAAPLAVFIHGGAFQHGGCVRIARACAAGGTDASRPSTYRRPRLAADMAVGVAQARVRDRLGRLPVRSLPGARGRRASGGALAGGQHCAIRHRPSPDLCHRLLLRRTALDEEPLPEIDHAFGGLSTVVQGVVESTRAVVAVGGGAAPELGQVT